MDDNKINLNKNSQNGSPDADALLKRGYMLLEDGEWEKARKYFSRSLDSDPENARAYLGRLMSHLKVKNKEDLKNVAEPFDHSKNYANIMRFGSEDLKAELQGYNEHIKERNTENAYKDAVRLMNSSQTESEFNKAEDAFKNLGNYKDSAELAEQCRTKAQNAKSKHAEESKKLGKKIGIIAGIAAAAVVFIVLLVNVIVPQVKYNNAVSLMEKGEYDEAVAAFRELGDLKDSKEKIIETQNREKADKYDNAVALMNAGNYEQAIVAFEELGDYNDSEEKIKEAHYEHATSLINSGNFNEAVEELDKAEDYQDSDKAISEETIKEVRYNYGVELMDSGNYEAASLQFEKSIGWKNSSSLLTHCQIKLGLFGVGDTFRFGTYNGDPITWVVIENVGSKTKVISYDVVAEQPYNNVPADNFVQWSECSLRTWLNNDFYNSAFSDTEKELILTTEVHNSAIYYTVDSYMRVPGIWGQPIGQNSIEINESASQQPLYDKLFLLSLDEALNLPINLEDKDYPDCIFWSTTPAERIFENDDFSVDHVTYGETAIKIRANGNQGYYEFQDNLGVRPVMWIGIEE